MNVTAGWVTAQNEAQSRWRLQGERGGGVRGAGEGRLAVGGREEAEKVTLV